MKPTAFYIDYLQVVIKSCVLVTRHIVARRAKEREIKAYEEGTT